MKIQILGDLATGLKKRWKWISSKGNEVPGVYYKDSISRAEYWFEWNPLDNTKDAFQLACELEITIEFHQVEAISRERIVDQASAFVKLHST